MNRLIAATKLAMVLLLAFIFIKFIVLSGGDEPAAPASTQARPSQRDSSSTRSPREYDPNKIEQIIAAEPFGKVTEDEPKKQPTETIEEPEPAEILKGYKLMGTITGPARIARAMIYDSDSDKTLTYKIDDRIETATLTEIQSNAVILIDEDTGQRLKLTLGDNGQSTDPVRSTVPDSNRFEPNRKEEDIPWGPEAILTHSTITPHIVNGQTEGLKLTDIEDIPFAGAIGLREGDVIKSINHQNLTSKQQAFQVMRKARTMPKLDLEIQSSGRSRNLSFNLP